MSRKTKLIITLGPATESEEMIGRLIDAGTNVFRLNMSHAKHEWAAEMAKRVRRQSEARGVHIAVLFDLTGPSIRTGDLETPYNLLEGDMVEFRKTGTDPTVPLSTTVNYDGLMGDVAVGNTLVVDNGALLMRIDAVEGDRILCHVKTPGTMGSRRHINLPGVRLNLPALTEKDHKDLSLAVGCRADYIAGSFVRDSAHVRELREAMLALEGESQIVAKVEDQEAIRPERVAAPPVASGETLVTSPAPFSSGPGTTGVCASKMNRVSRRFTLPADLIREITSWPM